MLAGALVIADLGEESAEVEVAASNELELPRLARGLERFLEHLSRFLDLVHDEQEPAHGLPGHEHAHGIPQTFEVVQGLPAESAGLVVAGLCRVQLGESLPGVRGAQPVRELEPDVQALLGVGDRLVDLSLRLEDLSDPVVGERRSGPGSGLLPLLERPEGVIEGVGVLPLLLDWTTGSSWPKPCPPGR